MRFFILLLLLIFPLFAEVGKITYIKGHVLLERDGTKKPALVGMNLKEKDVLKTNAASLIKLLFADKSAISIGSKSEFSIQNYLYDETKNSVAKFKLKKGVFRAITGKIAKITPKKFKLKTRTVTIGIRGTIFSGVVEENREEFFCEKGSIYVQSKGISMDVDKGFKTYVIPGRAPVKQRRYKQSDLKKVRSQTSGWKDKNCKTN